MQKLKFAVVLGAGLLALHSCYPYENEESIAGLDGGGTPGGTDADGGGGGASQADGGTNSTGGGGANQGFTCDVKNTLQARCLGCHGATPAGGASFSLVSLADFMKPSSVAGEDLGSRSLVRMQSTTAPMPPSPASRVPASEIASFLNWVQNGYAGDNCSGTGGVDGGGAPIDPYNTPDVCTSNKYWYFGENWNMRPGQTCIACHTKEDEGPRFTFAGTVYPTAHEPDKCHGVNLAGVQIVIIDKFGTSHNLSLSGSAGNFGTKTAFATPYTAKVVYQGRERVMATPQTNGDCNSCHTLRGANGAPGRIMLP